MLKPSIFKGHGCVLNAEKIQRQKMWGIYKRSARISGGYQCNKSHNILWPHVLILYFEAIDMFGKGSKLYSILFLKCPRCHEGAFLENHPYNLSSMNSVRDTCPKCGLKYKMEPSFYFGSMYVSYGVGVALAVAVYVTTLLLGLDLGLAGIFGVIIATLVLLMPYIGAISKSIWANFFFKYDREIAQKVKQNA
jgi:uncharacterized protein (DUF983 family)